MTLSLFYMYGGNSDKERTEDKEWVFLISTPAHFSQEYQVGKKCLSTHAKDRIVLL